MFTGMEHSDPNFETCLKSRETSLETARQNAKALAAQSHSENTLKAYETDWKRFDVWCQDVSGDNNISALPTNDETLALFVGHEHEIGTKPSTLKRILAAIRFVHLRAGYPSPFECAPRFNVVFRGYKRRWAGKKGAPQLAATEDVIVSMVDQWSGQDLLSLRNRALLLVGFDGAFRREELVGLNVEQISYTPAGAELYVPKSKEDPFGEGAIVHLVKRVGSDYCSVGVLKNWLQETSIEAGPVFRRFHRRGTVTTLGSERLSDRAVYELVKKSAVMAGLDGKFGAHSLRRGFINSAIERNQPISLIQEHVRHAHQQSTARYLQHSSNMHPSRALVLTSPQNANLTKI